MSNTTVLVTGANGFVGRAACRSMLERGWRVRAAVRSEQAARSVVPGAQPVVVGSIDGNTDWSEALAEIEVVVHLAARVHVMRETNLDPATEFNRINCDGTRNLALAAARLKVRRLVYVSSIKVNGESTAGRAFTEQDSPDPQDAYAISKWLAEQALWQISGQTGLEVSVVRPPLVYGPHVGGNFIQMLKAVDRGLPLPFASSNNLRSLIYVDNLADALAACASHPAAAGETFLVSDGQDVSTGVLLSKLAEFLGRSSSVFRFPPSLLRWLGRLINQSAALDRLLGSLQVDSGKIRTMLGWQPPFSLDQGLQQTASWYQREGR